MAIPSNNLPAEIVLSMPRKFQDEVTRRQSLRYLLAVAGCVALFVLFSLGTKTTPSVDAGALFLFINTVVWFAVLKKPWHYVLNETSLSLIWLKPYWGETYRHDLPWKQDVVLNVEQDEWRGLPALRIKAKLKGYKMPQDLWMVYAHEDRGMVQNVVLPLIEKYRKQYRHKLWADTLRQEKQIL